ncbi:hypothetical protein [Streptomyces violaceusniger]|uniref:Amidohydrolase 3 domain-containing protein n=1 Tax=Streptomyces violaceusniger TaxID=68280 RepID=A0A4D4KQ29_STRVO|nr:hypothetical protein SVIO_009170 [Streptomyces violaceusniger]
MAEFPTTVAAAKAAYEHGMPTVMGAPNVLRGNSHNGNASGRELVGRGLVTALASDYLPSGLLSAALLLAEEGLAPLPAAVGLVTGGAAAVAGLPDRGRLEEGLRANAASGVPLSAFAGVIAVDGVPTEALTSWLDTGRCWHTVAGQPSRTARAAVRSWTARR